MRTVSSLLIVLFLAFTTAAADARDALLGRWDGTSICTAARAACRDETVVYHVTPGPKANVVTMAMNKVVDEREVEIGVLDFQVDFAAHRMTADYDSGRVATRWTFSWNGEEMRGTAVLLPSGAVGRNIVVRRQTKTAS
jgi:hypothetical protein